MTALSIIKYHWRRRRTLSIIFVAGVVAVAFIMAITMMTNLSEWGMTVDGHGNITTQTTYNGIAFADDPSRLIDPSAFGLLVCILALGTVKRDREFLVSCSVPRHQIWLGTCGFLIVMSVGLAVIGGFIAPALCRAVLMLFGFSFRGGSTLATILTGGNADMFSSILIAAMQMVGSAGGYMLAGYMLLRWWKIILIAFVAFIAAIVLMVQMVQWETFLAQVIVDLAKWVEWAAERLIPLIETFLNQSNRMVWALRALGAGLGCMLLSYPILRGMKVT